MSFGEREGEGDGRAKHTEMLNVGIGTLVKRVKIVLTMTVLHRRARPRGQRPQSRQLLLRRRPRLGRGIAGTRDSAQLFPNRAVVMTGPHTHRHSLFIFYMPTPSYARGMLEV